MDRVLYLIFEQHNGTCGLLMPSNMDGLHFLNSSDQGTIGVESTDATKQVTLHVGYDVSEVLEEALHRKDRVRKSCLSRLI